MSKCINCFNNELSYFGDAQYKWCAKTLTCNDEQIERDCEYYNPKTNADKIRDMTDEELAERFVESLCMSICDFETATPEKCHACVLEWLRKEVEE